MTVACQQEQKSPLLSDDVFVAEVNGQKISLNDFNSLLRRFTAKSGELTNLSDSTKQSLVTLLLDELINRQILIQEAEKRAIQIDNSALQVFLNTLSAGYSPEEFDIQLKEVNFDSEEWKNLNRERLLISRLVNQEVTEKIEVNDILINEYISEHPQILNVPESYEVQHILVQSQELAQLIHNDIAAGASFSDYLDRYSIAADKINEGNMGFIVRGMLPETINDAIFSLKQVNQLSPVIKSPIGYHIFKLLSVQKAQKLRPAEVRDEIVKKIRSAKFDESYRTWFEDLRSKSSIRKDITAIDNDSIF